uniref:EF-hand domain-containing protein n=1 Tax=Chromera velia CCMP2878 TaxID=1169474 RepID=A0A0G4GIR2_9ALVE|eukprot:Cvel_22067.t1-p1 / transcript=Cvel_22067.t1 / gene=Cvel_22067 / organism=Chromera_velia_CCMP2878 / gene_product=FUN14 domain-containing protein 1, putative / transcript_product=FUN14 domain-containing protein 1, putative / location=Cvel_scaffold2132:13888-16989(-) / protein_length=177 / sequence_SO=supercontig / SO=protein_coding / is_pseudo=false
MPDLLLTPGNQAAIMSQSNSQQPPVLPPGDVKTFAAGFAEKVQTYMKQVVNVKSLNELGDLNQQVWDNPTLGVEKVGTGMIFGFISGYTMRQALKTAALVAGVGFVSLQLLAYNGYIKIEWKKFEKEVYSKFDLDGDGDLTNKDFEIAKAKVLKVLTWGLPSATGFGLGFVMGLKRW